jgi:hypothetical protein
MKELSVLDTEDAGWRMDEKVGVVFMPDFAFGKAGDAGAEQLEVAAFELSLR